jgi:hypothetical protein
MAVAAANLTDGTNAIEHVAAAVGDRAARIGAGLRHANAGALLAHVLGAGAGVADLPLRPAVQSIRAGLAAPRSVAAAAAAGAAAQGEPGVAGDAARAAGAGRRPVRIGRTRIARSAAMGDGVVADALAVAQMEADVAGEGARPGDGADRPGVGRRLTAAAAATEPAVAAGGAITGGVAAGVGGLVARVSGADVAIVALAVIVATAGDRRPAAGRPVAGGGAAD